MVIVNAADLFVKLCILWQLNKCTVQTFLKYNKEPKCIRLQSVVICDISFFINADQGCGGFKASWILGIVLILPTITNIYIL